jgi:hypothetical protein
MRDRGLIVNIAIAASSRFPAAPLFIPPQEKSIMTDTQRSHRSVTIPEVTDPVSVGR